MDGKGAGMSFSKSFGDMSLDESSSETEESPDLSSAWSLQGQMQVVEDVAGIEGRNNMNQGSLAVLVTGQTAATNQPVPYNQQSGRPILDTESEENRESFAFQVKEAEKIRTVMMEATFRKNVELLGKLTFAWCMTVPRRIPPRTVNFEDVHKAYHVFRGKDSTADPSIVGAAQDILKRMEEVLERIPYDVELSNLEEVKRCVRGIALFCWTVKRETVKEELKKIKVDYDPHQLSPRWRNARVINDIQTNGACVLKAFGVLLSFWYNLGPVQLLSQVAVLVSQVIGEDLLRVILHFCNPSEGWYTPAPLLYGRLLRKVLSFSQNGDMSAVLQRVAAYLTSYQLGPIFIIGLEKGPSEVGHCAPGLCCESGIICGCDPDDFVGVLRVHIYILPSDIEETLRPFRIPNATTLTLNGTILYKSRSLMVIHRFWCPGCTHCTSADSVRLVNQPV